MKICKKCSEPYEGKECGPCHLLRAKKWFGENKEKNSELQKKQYKKRNRIV